MFLAVAAPLVCRTSTGQGLGCSWPSWAWLCPFSRILGVSQTWRSSGEGQCRDSAVKQGEASLATGRSAVLGLLLVRPRMADLNHLCLPLLCKPQCGCCDFKLCTPKSSPDMEHSGESSVRAQWQCPGEFGPSSALVLHQHPKASLEVKNFR